MENKIKSKKTKKIVEIDEDSIAFRKKLRETIGKSFKKIIKKYPSGFEK